ncbi:hypothetical protein KY330_02425 [Candidatus Woesearchaeota archaeon]|nr:hypothetical protein [Candidatus Woesearchaeota archaeon]
MKKLIILLMLVVLIVGCTSVAEDTGDSVDDFVDIEITEDSVVDDGPEDITVDDQVIEAKYEYVIEIRSSMMVPDPITIKPYTKVIWANAGAGQFYLLGDDVESFETDLIKSGNAFAWVYAKPGTYTYILVPGKEGKIVVKE